jgi:hypothetical protein
VRERHKLSSKAGGLAGDLVDWHTVRGRCARRRHAVDNCVPDACAAERDLAVGACRRGDAGGVAATQCGAGRVGGGSGF